LKLDTQSISHDLKELVSLVLSLRSSCSNSQL
jgi:hypothetical protein